MKKNKNQKRIISEQFFSDALEKIIFNFPERSKDIIKTRFGITAKNPQTLESVGNKHQITRERVRQIIGEIIKKIKNQIGGDLLEQVFQEIEFTVKRNNGIISTKDLLVKLSNNPKQQGSIRFFLECADRVKIKKEKDKIEDSIILVDFDFSYWKETIEQVKLLLEEEKRTFESEELFEKISGKNVEIDKKKLFHFLSISKEIKKNNFSRWGMAKWSEINPKGTKEKTFLVMKEEKKHLHYREVASLIDKHGLSKKKAHPQTVHNELIKDSRFVLVGRGKYALAEWGYKKGTVKDILEEILSRSNQPVKCKDILSEVLSLRQVKKSTVMINLNSSFVRAGKDKYTVKK